MGEGINDGDDTVPAYMLTFLIWMFIKEMNEDSPEITKESSDESCDEYFANKS